ncbi:hypothetical protein HBH56_047030 [Parastagonospora nodorum]|nr:hypothetical protein HBH56_047030 [Parastagonospora nodorum]KAH3933127.1 hypothetical protein HBH54_074770 [Parastagonospora nodorum]KAH3946271.1 hypothetical protein HBH53_133910 [Parastagonospora nodorum]KAH3973003.1 hypothetical protein HBH52_146830 [Parastagonospora nodorum]KAH3980733.1 hypothetical protein HBH51_052760 [Parastagonospora nodorum]
MAGHVERKLCTVVEESLTACAPRLQSRKKLIEPNAKERTWTQGRPCALVKYPPVFFTVEERRRETEICNEKRKPLD